MFPEVIFRALGDETRLRCLVLLHLQEELCVCELTHALQLAQPKISRHLAVLKNAHLLQDHREGVWIYYRLHPDLPEWIRDVLQKTQFALQKQSPYTEDKQRLLTMPNRPGSLVCA
ncbi:transcriptional regulator [Thioflexithrix psekupsensis]|uniref:Transcriptional regulator n=1 Tax=Thioflexithrix psekupsensis TaxID=1570016 RepID=A0A251X9Q5_9GAMM|nr:transcriptional regulator [Thioflexithrix psekupsensis]